MAKIYIVKCPTCGHEFKVTKGILVKESVLNSIPEDREEETPFNCPVCGHMMRIEDEDFMKRVVAMTMVD